MNNDNFCTLKNLTKFIKKNKDKGLRNQEIINQIIKKGCCFQTIFEAINKTVGRTR